MHVNMNTENSMCAIQTQRKLLMVLSQYYTEVKPMVDEWQMIPERFLLADQYYMKRGPTILEERTHLERKSLGSP